MKVRGCELIAKDPRVAISWDCTKSQVVVEGTGECELGDVSEHLVVKGSVVLTAADVAKSVLAAGHSVVKVQSAGKSAISVDSSRLHVEKVCWYASSHGSSTLTAAVVVGWAYSHDESRMTITAEARSGGRGHDRSICHLPHGCTSTIGHPVAVPVRNTPPPVAVTVECREPEPEPVQSELFAM